MQIRVHRFDSGTRLHNILCISPKRGHPKRDIVRKFLYTICTQNIGVDHTKTPNNIALYRILKLEELFVERLRFPILTPAILWLLCISELAFIQLQRIPVGSNEFILIGALATLAALAEILVIKALELTQTVILAPIHYTLLIWGTAYGWMVFGQFPDQWTWFGSAMIFATGIYVVLREWSKKNQR